MRPGDTVEWNYHPNHTQRGTVEDVPGHYGGRWASVVYGGDREFATLIETCRLRIVRQKAEAIPASTSGPGRRVRSQGDPAIPSPFD